MRLKGVFNSLSALASMLCGPPFAVAVQPPELSREALLKSSTPDQLPGKPEAIAESVDESPIQISDGFATAVGIIKGITLTTAVAE